MRMAARLRLRTLQLAADRGVVLAEQRRREVLGTPAGERLVVEAQWRADMRKFGTAPLEPLTPAPAPFVAPPQQYGVRELDL